MKLENLWDAVKTGIRYLKSKVMSGNWGMTWTYDMEDVESWITKKLRRKRK